jgi:hypothetical protein
MTRPDPGKPRLFYKTKVSFTVLSEEPIPGDMTLGTIRYECDEGRYVGCDLDLDTVLVNGSVMVDELYKAGSEPGFFELDDAGKDFEWPERDFDFEKDD